MPDLEKKYIYKISRGGVFLNVLPNVVSPFNYSLDVNNPFTSLTITVGVTADTAHDATEAILTENGVPITNELGQDLLIERQPDLVGENALINNGNDIEVYEYSATYPNGQLVFSGYISKWKTVFGASENINITCLSYGVELDNYVIMSGDTVDVNHADFTGYYSLGNSKFEERTYNWQSFTVGAGVTTLSSVAFQLLAETSASIGALVTVEVFNSQADAESFTSTPLGTASIALRSTSYEDYKFTFPSSITVTAAGVYYARLSVGWDAGTVVYHVIMRAKGSVPGSYAGGTSAYWNLVSWSPQTSDLNIATYTSSGNTTAPYTSVDPSAILEDIIDEYSSRGGTVNYTAASIDNTGASVTYTFNFNTVLEGIQKVLTLAPSGWYWTVDPGTSLLTFKQASTTADHTMIYGRHISELEIEATIENIKNNIYFTGGDSGGTNIFVREIDATSLLTTRPGLARLSDNRVTLQATADAIVDGYLDENNDEKYITRVRILDGTYDISLFNPGETVGFSGFGTFVDNLILQIVRIEREVDAVTLSLGVLRKRLSTEIETARRSLIEVQTVDNPSAPS